MYDYTTPSLDKFRRKFGQSICAAYIVHPGDCLAGGYSVSRIFFGLSKVPHFCYAIAVTVCDRTFGEAIEIYGLVTTPMTRKMGFASGALVCLMEEDHAHHGDIGFAREP